MRYFIVSPDASIAGRTIAISSDLSLPADAGSTQQFLIVLDAIVRNKISAFGVVRSVNYDIVAIQIVHRIDSYERIFLNVDIWIQRQDGLLERCCFRLTN